MQHYTDILFDLDGTLTDSSGGITDCFRRAMEAFGYSCPSAEELKGQIIGPPIEASMRHYGVAEDTIDAMTREFRVHYNDHGWCNNRVYDGIPQMLKRLFDAGFRMSLATSKPEHMAVAVLEHFGLSQYFEKICGAVLDGSRDKKEEVIAYLLKNCGALENAVMVGDSAFDITGAKAHGIPGIGVSWGYGSVSDMQQAGAIAIAHDPEALWDLLNK